MPKQTILTGVHIEVQTAPDDVKVLILTDGPDTIVVPMPQAIADQVGASLQNKPAIMVPTMRIAGAAS